MVGGPRWVSQWATLAASHIRTDPEGSGGESHIMVTEDRGSYRNSHLNRKDTEILVGQLICNIISQNSGKVSNFIELSKEAFY